MKKFLNLAILVSIFSLSLSPTTLNATTKSETKSDNGISVNLTIDPDDPIALEQANFEVSFSDPSGYFTLTRCDCKLTINEDSGSKVFETAVSQDTLYVDKEKPYPIKYTFRKEGSYRINISGTSLNKSFKNFLVTFELKINQQHESQFVKRVRAAWRLLIGDVMPAVVVLMFIPFGWRFLIAGAGKRH